MAFDRIKSLFKGFKKGGEKMEDVSRLPSAASSTMKLATDIWWSIFKGEMQKAPSHKNMHPIRMASFSTAYLAQLVCTEIKYELADETLNGYVMKNLLPNLDSITQKTLVGGYTVIKPYITPSGRIFFDVGTSRDFKPIAFDENGHIIEGEFRERINYKGTIYERREYHRFDGSTHYIRNTAYRYGTQHSVELSTIPRWAALLPEGEIPSDIPMIATFRTPYANNIDLDSELPISLFANAVDVLHNIDKMHSEYLAEFEKKRAKVFADAGVIDEKTGKVTDDYFVGFDIDLTRSIEQQIMTYAPDIREVELREGINTELRLYEMLIGLSCGTFTFDTQKGAVTATQVLSEDITTFNTVKQLQKQLNSALTDLAYITENLARHYGMDVTEGEPVIEFGDSVFEDTGTEYNRRFQLVNAGMLKPELFNAWYFGVTPEKALEMMPPMAQAFGGDE